MNQIQMAMLVLGLVGFCFALILAVLNRKLKVEDDPKVKEILEALPGLNCGACGFSGCRVFAKRVVKENKLFSGCLPGGEEVNQKIAKILGFGVQSAKTNRVVVCLCGAEAKEKKADNIYQGPADCRAAQITGGAINCFYGCLGFGDCLGVCPVGALSLKNKKIYVDLRKCVGCAKCLAACPQRLFRLVPVRKSFLYSVACSNKDKAIEVKKVCSRGCVGCSLCTRVDDSPYYLKDNLSYIDYSKDNNPVGLRAGKDKCPTKCIFEFNV